MEALAVDINCIQVALLKIGRLPLELPQIVVLGDKSSGKSCILERILQKDFLPKGDGFVTRRPLIIHVENKLGNSEHCEFEHTGEKEFKLSEVASEIKNETQRVCGESGASPEPILLRIYSPDVVNMTFVDLPGLAEGEIGDLAEFMAKQQIHRENSVIITVATANDDVRSSKAIKLAKSSDPRLMRTICVLTKLDSVKEGKDVLPILEGRVLPKRFIGLVNRTQKQIDEGVSHSDALKAEEKFFQEHPKYKQVAAGMGIRRLREEMCRILSDSVERALPYVRESVAKEIVEAERELAELQSNITDKNQKSKLIFRAVTAFTKVYSALLDGELGDEEMKGITVSNDVVGAAVIRRIFRHSLVSRVNSIDLGGQLTDEALRQFVFNTGGTDVAFHNQRDAYLWAIKYGCQQLREPCMDCIQDVMSALNDVCVQAARNVPEFDSYPKLREFALKQVNIILEEFHPKARALVDDLIGMEMSFIDLRDALQFGGGDALSPIKTSVETGWLLKKGGKHSTWSTRFFTLVDRHLSWGHGSWEITPAGQLPLHHCVLAEPTKLESDDLILRVERTDGGILYNSRRCLELKAESRGDYIRWRKLLATAMDQKSKSIEEMEQLHVIRYVSTRYFKAVCKSILDKVPKAIMYALVSSSKESIENDLVVNCVYAPQTEKFVGVEDPRIVERRLLLNGMLGTLKEALTELEAIEMD